MKNIKVPLFILAGFISIVLLSIFIINGFQNKAIGLEEQIKTADSDIKIQEKEELIYYIT